MSVNMVSEASIYRVYAAISKVLSIEMYLLPKQNTTADLYGVLFLYYLPGSDRRSPEGFYVFLFCWLYFNKSADGLQEKLAQTGRKFRRHLYMNLLEYVYSSRHNQVLFVTSRNLSPYFEYLCSPTPVTCSISSFVLGLRMHIWTKVLSEKTM